MQMTKKQKTQYYKAKEAIKIIAQITETERDPKRFLELLQLVLDEIYVNANKKDLNEFKSFVAFSHVADRLKTRENKIKFSRNISKKIAYDYIVNYIKQKESLRKISEIMLDKYNYKISKSTVHKIKMELEK